MLSDNFWFLLEWFGVITGLFYLWLEFRQKMSMWIIGGISSFAYVFIYGYAQLYADMGFYIYNVIISIYGVIRWRKNITGTSEATQLEYSYLSYRMIILLLGITTVIYIVLYLLLSKLTDSPVPYFDAFTTALSITAAWMLARRFIAHWWVWTIVDGASVVLYYIRGLYPTMLLFAFYTLAAIIGYYYWKRNGRKV